MRTKKLIEALFLGSVTMMNFAQTAPEPASAKFTLGAWSGLNILRLTGSGGNPLSEGWSSCSGAAFGLTLDWNSAVHFGWRADILYSGEGGKRTGMQAFDGYSFNPQLPAGSYLYANYDNESVLHYLEIPVMAKYTINLGKFSRFYLDLGPYLGILFNASLKTSGSSIVYADAGGTEPVSVNPQTGQPFPVSFDANANVTNDINRLNFGITGGIGFSKGVGLGNIFLDIRGAYGMTNLQKDSKSGSNNTVNLLLAV